MSIEKEILEALLELQSDGNRRSIVIAPVSNYTSSAQEHSEIVKAGPGILYGLLVYNNNAGAQWIQIHDSATVPADGAVPAITFDIATQAAKTLDYGLRGRKFAKGIYVCNSTTDVTKTLGAADCLFDIQFD